MAKVYISDIIEAPIDKVWALARDFNGHGDWHPRIAQSTIEDGLPPDHPGLGAVTPCMHGLAELRTSVSSHLV